MQDYDEYLRKTNELFEEVKNAGVTPVEVHNRFALLYLERLDLPEPTEDVSEMLKTEGRTEYDNCKLVVGTMMMGVTQQDEELVYDAEGSEAKVRFADTPPQLSSFQALAKDRGWVLRHYDVEMINTEACIDVIGKAFQSTIRYMPRLCDLRICLQMGSPGLWHLANASDYMLLQDGAKEKGRIDEFGDVIHISEATFAHELIKYLEEHMKYEMPRHERKLLRSLIRGELQLHYR